MKKRSRAIVWLGLILTLALPNESARANTSSSFQEAVKPLEEGIPQVAIVRLRALLSSRLSEDDRRTATAKLGEALGAAGQPDEALTILNDPLVRDLPGTRFPKAQALAALSRWMEALPLYQQAATDASSPVRADAIFGQAECLRALGSTDEALQTLGSLTTDPRWSVRASLRSVELLIDKKDTAGAARLLDAIQLTSVPDKKVRRFLRGRIAAQENHPEKAARLFATILKSPEGAAHSVLIADLFAIADAHLQKATPGNGDDFLEDFIERHPDDPDLAAIFAKLDELYAAERKQSRHELPRWSKDKAQPRRALALWYLARAELRPGHREGAEQAFEQLRGELPSVPVLAEALLEYAQFKMDEGQSDNAISILETARTLHPSAAVQDRIDLITGRALYAAGRFEGAAKMFQQIARTDSSSANTALFNASLAWLQAGDAPQLAATTQELKVRGGDEQTRADLLLEEGLGEAGKGEKDAGNLLLNFLRDFPTHPKASEAWIALAELDFHASPPQLDDARQKLAQALAAQPTPLARERADYLSIWLEQAATTPNETKLIELANAFLRAHESSSLVPEVRLKLAEIYFRRENFASARTQFEILAQQNPTSPLAEKAQFFAAQSAMKTMGAASLDRALVLFDEVVKRNGELKWAARNEQAVIERKLGKTQDAMTLYDEVLKGDAKPAEKFEALCGKGDILYDLGPADRENYKRAIEIYSQLPSQEEASAHWRNQALFKKGMCLEKLNESEQALATFYQIIEDESRPDRRREFFWFYKAGFNAARLLEEQAQWQPAAVIYEKLAFAGGARSEEAKARLNRLRLEHFLWQE